MYKNYQDNRHSPTSQNGLIIGWREIVALPQLNIDKIKAKIDTGARSSAIHAFNIKEFFENGLPMISFQVHPLQRSDRTTLSAKAQLLEYREVKNSGGTVELRPVILTEITLRGQKWTIDLTLTNRELMGFRMLLGREAVRNKFLVDPGKSYLQSDRKDNNN
ncbi:MAG: RimK/LysX family protein [Cyanobacteria bacterium P01_G01_bin.19]